jgi:hypothetical protein
MELRQLRYFVGLAEELHFGRAAAREHIVQSALSQQLQYLERELGVPLLKRTTHHVQLTEAGSVFLHEVRQILVAQRRCVLCASASCVSALPEIVWRNLILPVSHYPWSVLWRACNHSKHVSALIASARTLSRQLRWLQPPRQAVGEHCLRQPPTGLPYLSWDEEHLATAPIHRRTTILTVGAAPWPAW